MMNFSYHSVRSAKVVMILAIVVLFAAQAHASKFWGIVSSEPLYIRQAWVVAEGRSLCTMAQISPQSFNGWGLLSYVPGAQPIAVGVSRSPDGIYSGSECTAEYVTALSTAARNGAQVLLGHARRNTASAPIPGPHPFLYPRFRDFYALAHNGTIYGVAALEDSMGAGYAALDSFVTRQWTT